MQRFMCVCLVFAIASLLAGCQAEWAAMTNQPPAGKAVPKSNNTVTVKVTSTQPPAATQAGSADPQAAQLSKEVQEYVNNLAMDDLEARVARHEGRPVPKSPAAPGTLDEANSPDDLTPGTNVAGGAPVEKGKHIPLAPEVIVPNSGGDQPAPAVKPAQPKAADALAARKVSPAAVGSMQPIVSAGGAAVAGAPVSSVPTGATTPPAQANPAAQVVEIDIAPSVLTALASQPAARIGQPRTNQPAAVQTSQTDELKVLIEQLRKQAADRPDSVGAALRLRLAEWSLTGDASPEEWPLQDADKRRLAQSLWQVLQVVSKMEASPQGAPSGEFQKAIESLTETLQQTQPLQIPTALLCRSVSSFGCPDPMPEPWQFPAGRTSMVVLYCELAGFKSEINPAKANWYRTLLSQRLAILTASGKELWNFEDQQVEDYCRKPRRDFFITKLLKIPAELPAGDYVLKVTIRDKLGNRVAETNIPFGVTLASASASQK